MNDAVHLETTRRDYDLMAEQYAEFVHDPANDDPFGRAAVRAFADLVHSVGGNGHVADLGCGPGHLTDLLDQLGLQARGIDLSPSMIELARRARPCLRFEVGSMLCLDIADGALSGVLAHFSIIHTPPEQVPTALAEMARVLADGGYVLVGFQTGDETLVGSEAFDHKVTPAYRWSIDAVAGLMRSHRLAEVARLRVEAGPGKRFPYGYLIARKTA